MIRLALFECECFPPPFLDIAKSRCDVPAQLKLKFPQDPSGRSQKKLSTSGTVEPLFYIMYLWK